MAQSMRPADFGHDGQPPSKSRGEVMSNRETVVVPPPTVPRLIVKVKLHCPHCGERHIDGVSAGDKRWDRRAHTTHRCSDCKGDFDVYVSGASDEELDERSKA